MLTGLFHFIPYEADHLFGGVVSYSFLDELYYFLVNIKFIFIRFAFLRRSFGNKHLNLVINIVRVIKRTFRGTWRWWWRCWWLYSPFWSAWVPCFHHVKQGIEPLAKSTVFLVPLYPCCCLLGQGSLFTLADTLLEFGSHLVDCHCELFTSSWYPLFQLIQDFGIDWAISLILGISKNQFVLKLIAAKNDVNKII